MSRKSKLRAGYVKRIHVNQNVIRKNVKENTDEPVVTVQTSEGSLAAHEVEVVVDDVVVCRIVTSAPQLSCGARVWIETEEQVRLVYRAARHKVEQ